MISEVELKRHVSGASILGIILSKLCHKQKPCPVILLKVDKSPKVGFHRAILPLSLNVYLRVKSNEKSLFDP